MNARMIDSSTTIHISRLCEINNNKMGILNFGSVFRKYVVQHTLSSIDNSIPYNIYADGNLVLHKGAYNHCIDPYVIAENAYNHFMLLVNGLRRNYDIRRVMIYIDGVSPTMKQKTSQRRHHHVKFDVHTALDHFKTLFDNQSVDIKQLELGESEMQMILERDTSVASLLVTSDSDVYHVAYDRCHDTAPLYLLTNGPSFVDLTNFTVRGMPRNLFTCIVLLMGTDYTQSLVTSTMVMSIIECFSMRESDSVLEESFNTISQLDLTKDRSWRVVLHEICSIILRAKNKHGMKINFGRRKGITCTEHPKLSWHEKQSVSDLVENLAWCTRYYDLGNMVDKYCNNKRGYTTIDSGSQWKLMRGAQFYGVGELVSWRTSPNTGPLAFDRSYNERHSDDSDCA